MILSASGWRKVFAISGQEQDKTSMIGEDNIALSIFAAKVFSDYIKKISTKSSPLVVLGQDARPTGSAICEACVKTFLNEGIKLEFLGITAAPEIMAYSKNADGFMYISASHNPVGHNGIKFGLNDGGVLNGKQNALLVKEFNALCNQENSQEKAFALIKDVTEDKIAAVYRAQNANKEKALKAYSDFLKETISGTKDKSEQEKIFNIIKEFSRGKKIGIVCDMNGSARSVSVDRKFFENLGLNFYAIHEKPGEIAHEIIPEAENLVYVASEMEKLHKEGHTDAVLGYMPDCDGDRGNIVFWDDEQKKAVILKAQEVFSLSVLSELLYQEYTNKQNKAVCVNCPTSLRIEEIAGKLNAKVYRAEVGEANVVNLAREKRSEGFDVRIFGEGSNGGTITYPSAVRDPINTIFALLKLLTVKEMYSIWCKKNILTPKTDFALNDVIKTLPEYTTTGVSEPRAVLKIKTTDHAELKRKFQKIFEAQWKEQTIFLENYGIYDWECRITNGTKETCSVTDFSKSGKGGLKIVFLAKDKTPDSFIWMRGSGTEPVFRIMCDVKGHNPEKERALLAWETEMLLKADEE